MSSPSTSSRDTARIVMIDDSVADASLVERSLERIEARHRFETFLSGDEAVTQLLSDAEDGICPDLILLDLNMPGMSGHEVLQTLKNHHVLCAVPVVILSTSTSSSDVQSAYEQRANAYVNKPLRLKDFEEAIEKIYSFWCDAALLPRGDG